MTFRKRIGQDTWHFCSNCSNWPKVPGTFTDRATKPASGELCNECRAKRAAGTCR